MLFVGKAQEKTTTYRTEKAKFPDTGKTYPWIVRATALVNQYYFYCVDKDFGPFFIKFSSYFPYNAKLCLLTELLEDRPIGLVTVRCRDGRAARSGRAGGGPARQDRRNQGPIRALSAA